MADSAEGSNRTNSFSRKREILIGARESMLSKLEEIKDTIRNISHALDEARGSLERHALRKDSTDSAVFIPKPDEMASVVFLVKKIDELFATLPALEKQFSALRLSIEGISEDPKKFLH